MSIELCKNKNFFFNILEKIVPNIRLTVTFISYMSLETKYESFPPIDYINQLFMVHLNNSNKYIVLSDYLNNPFLSSSKKDELLGFICLAQKTKRGIERLGRVIKNKRVKLYGFDSDLCLEPLTSLNQKFVVPIIHGKTKYLFRIHDLIRLIENGMLYAPNLFSEPQIAKNPHTNIEFTCTDLYNIYFHALDARIKLPYLFHLFFLSEFDTNRLLENYETVIRDEVLRKKSVDMSEYDKYDEIIDMIEQYREYMPSIVIHEDFDDAKVVERFKHTLLNYLYVKYSYNMILKVKKQKLLISQLKKIHTETPRFGSVYIHINRQRRVPIIPQFPIIPNIFHDLPPAIIEANDNMEIENAITNIIDILNDVDTLADSSDDTPSYSYEDENVEEHDEDENVEEHDEDENIEEHEFEMNNIIFHQILNRNYDEMSVDFNESSDEN